MDGFVIRGYAPWMNRRQRRETRDFLGVASAWDKVAGWLERQRDRMIVFAGGFSQVAAKKILEHALSRTAWTMPTKVYVSLLTVVPTSATKGTELTEVTLTNYVKLELTGKIKEATEGTTTTIKNNATLTFAEIVSAEAAQEVVGWAITDSSAAKTGNMIVWGECTGTKVSKTQTPPTIENEKLEVTLK